MGLIAAIGCSSINIAGEPVMLLREFNQEGGVRILSDRNCAREARLYLVWFETTLAKCNASSATRSCIPKNLA